MMGADAPIPPVAMNGRRPEGRPAAASISFKKISQNPQSNLPHHLKIYTFIKISKSTSKKELL
jgi:hypothetical protein